MTGGGNASWLTCLALLLALGAAPQRALAWGAEGHRMVGEIASRHLSTTTAQRVAYLLGRDRLADGTLSGRDSLAEVASWADEIKDHPHGRRKGAWHYDNIPLCGTPDRLNFCKAGNCASAQLERNIALLASPGATRRQRNEALKWVVHLVGDIHQPLHTANRQDRGGNLVQVSFFGERDNPPWGSINLHTVWDVHLLRKLNAEKAGERGIVTMPFEAREREAMERGTRAQWIAESHQIARSVAYSIVPKERSCGGHIEEVLAVDQAYYARAAPVVESQIRKAGLRLARILNEVLGTP